MKLNNKGFALTSMIYMLIVLFLMIMLLVLSNLAQRKVILDKVTYDIKNKLDQGVTVNAAELPYQNQTTGIYYETLELAITKATSGDTIKVLKNVTDQSTPSIPQGKEIKIDIAGKEVTLSQMITNSGNLDIYTSEPEGIIYNSNQKTIKNNSTGTLTINDTNNINTLFIINTTTSSGSRIFVNDGNLTINNANIEIKNAPSPSSTTDSYLITNYKRVEINDSTLTNVARNTTNDCGIINISGYSNARIVFNSGTIRTGGPTIYNNGGTSSSFDDPVIEVNGGTIISNKYNAIRENLAGAYDVINGGEIYNENIPGSMVVVHMNGKLKMTGGTIYAYNGSGINLNGTSSADITGGHIVKDKNPITNSWVGGAAINTAGTSNLTVAGNAVIESKSGKCSNVIYHASTGTTTITGNALVENKGAVTAMTIKSSGKILVTGGKVKSNGGQAIVNTYDNSTSSSYGKIEITGGTVETTGELAVNTNSAYGTITVGTLGAASNTYPQIKGTVRGSLTTAGPITINSGTITATTKEAVHTKKTLIVNGGVITGVSSYGIISNDANSKITINGGTITAPSTYAVTTTNAMGGEIEINGGTITKTGGANATVNNYLGTTTIKGGTITSTTASGVYTSSGTITIGEKTIGIPSTSTPIITGKTYGVEAGSGTIKFYNGQITGNVGKSLSKDPADIAVGSRVNKTSTSTTETATLNLMYVTSGAQAIFDAGTGETGTTWTPLVGNAATLNNATWGTNYINLNGTNAWVNMGRLDSTKQSIELTFSVNQIPTATQYILANVETGGVGIYMSDTAKVQGTFYISEASAYKYTGISNTIMSTGTVYHVAVTYDGSTLKLYVNGTLEKSTSVSGNIKPAQSNTVMAIGTNPYASSGTTPYFNGKIYSAAVYNRALTAAEVQQNYRAGMHAAGITVN